MQFEGHNGVITIEQDDLVISREGVRGRFGGALEQRIPLDDIEGAYLEPPPDPRRTGYLQLVLAGKDEEELTRAQAAVHPDVVTFSARQAPAFERLRNWLEDGGELEAGERPDPAMTSTAAVASTYGTPPAPPAPVSAPPTATPPLTAPMPSTASRPPGAMGPVAAVTSALTKYVTFQGRARRSEYWWFVLAATLVYALFIALDIALGTTFLGVVAALALLLPTLSVLVRRLHDTDRSGWWYFISLIPIVGPIILLVFLVKDSQPGDNRYGTSPKQPT